MGDVSISNVINISVSAVQQGIGQYNTSNLAIFTRDSANNSFPSTGFQLYLSPQQVALDFGTNSATYAMAVAVFSQQPNILANGGCLIIIHLKTAGETGTTAETVGTAITRTSGLVQYFGIMTAEIVSQSDMLAAAAIVQPMNKIAAFVSKTSADAASGGMLDMLRSGSFDQSRGLLYAGTGLTSDALGYMASYMGRGLSVNFSGSRTTSTMHLKSLKAVQPDAAMTDSLLAQCKAAGVDVYVSFRGVPKVFSSGKNRFFDQVYNQQWFVGALEVAGFNVLATVGTKIAQTEEDLKSLKGGYRKICEQGLKNQYLAPGAWTDPTTFGNQDDFFNNIAQKGYYIYSAPISEQSDSDRGDRIAPLIQIAVKEAGSTHSSSVLININP
jgi:hypothetical protein